MGGMASLVAVVPVGIAFLAALILAPWDKTIIVEPFVWDHTPTPSTADVNKPEFQQTHCVLPFSWTAIGRMAVHAQSKYNNYCFRSTPHTAACHLHSDTLRLGMHAWQASV